MLGRSKRENLEEKVDNGETAFTVSVHFLKMSNIYLLLALKKNCITLNLQPLSRQKYYSLKCLNSPDMASLFSKPNLGFGGLLQNNNHAKCRKT